MPMDAAVNNSPKDWPEDAVQENGAYACVCCECGCQFVGHKRRVMCRSCDLAAWLKGCDLASWVKGFIVRRGELLQRLSDGGD